MSYNQAISPPQQPALHPYSPAAYSPQGAGSPTSAYAAPPPAKRQRLSPDARSPPAGAVIPPYASSPHSLPSVGGYGNPYAPSQSPYASSAQGSFNTPPPPATQQQWPLQPPMPATGPGRQASPPNPQSQMQSSQMMPPPPRPKKEERDERMNIDDIGDSMFGSGVSLKDEENYMHATFNNQHQHFAGSFASTPTTSFGSSVVSPNNSFNLLTQGTSFGSQPAHDGAFAGTTGQTQTQEQVEDEDRHKRSAASRARNERFQHHLNNQFLLTNCVRARLIKKAQDEGVTTDNRGLYIRSEEPQTRTQTMINGDSGIAAVDSRPKYTAGKGEPFEHLMSLVSLAAGERLRGLVDDAFALARARRYGDHGRVPPEFADIAIGESERREEEVVPENVTGSQWDKLPEAEGDGDTANDVKDTPTATPKPHQTASFQSSVASTLREVAKREQAAEEERAKKREARRKRAEEAANAAEEAALDTPAPDGVSEATAPAKMTKKEQERQKKEANKNADALSHSTTNQTAAMMALGSKGKKYSWMTGASATRLENKWAKPTPTASGAATPNAGIKSEAASPSATGMSLTASGQGANAAAEKVLEWGDWREDGPGGKGIQPRDWAFVLERDGRDKIALQRAYNRLG